MAYWFVIGIQLLHNVYQAKKRNQIKYKLILLPLSSGHQTSCLVAVAGQYICTHHCPVLVHNCCTSYRCSLQM